MCVFHAAWIGPGLPSTPGSNQNRPVRPLAESAFLNTSRSGVGAGRAGKGILVTTPSRANGSLACLFATSRTPSVIGAPLLKIRTSQKYRTTTLPRWSLSLMGLPSRSTP